MTGLKWYGAPLLEGGFPPLSRWPNQAHIELADAQTDAREHGDLTGEWLADFTPEARAELARKQIDERLDIAEGMTEEERDRWLGRGRVSP